EEKALIIGEFNDTYHAYPRDKTVAELFEEQVEKTPNQIAVTFEDKEITYRELNQKANVLAYKLRSLGIQPNDYVAIMAERSIEMIIGIY
ncbi:AMP-binding protein, partial [Bacillus thuringiensis]|uniref:AMP-binding protein n=1 Tax=Bacillus thuringiensis TaxID=1428 RepID=UPI002FBF11E0